MTVSDVPGDCHKDVCTNGAVTNVVDNNDLPADNNPCTTDTCSSGTPQNMNVAAGMTCGTNGMCNGNGACVGCIADANCPAGNDCQIPVCMAGGVCGFTPRAEFTPLSDLLSPGDCHHDECDGAGAIRTIVDTNDTPSNNGNECLQGTCSSGGAPSVIPRGVASCAPRAREPNATAWARASSASAPASARVTTTNARRALASRACAAPR